MKQCFGLVITTLVLLILPVSGPAQRDADIPPMLQDQGILSNPGIQPGRRPPEEDLDKSTPQLQKGTKDKKAKMQTSGKRKASLAGKPKGKKTNKKRGEAAQPQSRSEADRT